MSCMTLDESFNLFEYWGCNKGYSDVLSDQRLLGTSADSPLVTYPSTFPVMLFWENWLRWMHDSTL